MTEWKKSSRCGSSACVEVAVGDVVEVRETGRAAVVAFEPGAWRAFLGFVRVGGVDA